MLFAISAVIPAQGQDNARLHNGLQEVPDTFRDSYDFPGATVAVALPDDAVIIAATGLADVEAGTPMTPDSRMLAASIGKTFVAATVLQLESDGRLLRADLWPIISATARDLTACATQGPSPSDTCCTTARACPITSTCRSFRLHGRN